MLGYIAPFKAWAIAISLAALIAGIGLYIHGAEKAKAQVIVLERDIDDLERKNQTGKAAVESCKAANEQNRQEAEAQKKRADAAVARNATRDKEADDEVTRIRHESAQFGNADCPALDDSFRNWLRE